MISALATSLRGRQRLLAAVIGAELIAGIVAVPTHADAPHHKQVAAGQVTATPPPTVGAPSSSSSVTAAAPTVATTVPPPPPIAVAPGPGTATVSWTAFPGGAPAYYTVTAANAPFGQVASLTACGTCTSVHFRGLVNGLAYTFTVSAPGRSIRRAASATPQSDLCASSPVTCVAVDSTVGLGAATRSAQGFLGAIDANTDASRIAALHPTTWRAGSGSSKGQAEDALIRRFTTNTIQIISNYWIQSTYRKDQGGAQPPWADWSLYSSYVTDLVREIDREGWGPAYWEIANEPDAGYPYVPGTVVTIPETLMMYDVGYHAIKAADPNARIIGPSLTGFTHDPIPGSPQLLDLTTFLNYANAHGDRFDAIALHETGAQQLTPYNRRPEVTSAHVDQLRSELFRWPNLGQPQIFVDEYGVAPQLDSPGWRLADIAAIELSDAGMGADSCWLANQSSPDYCGAHALNGLLDNDETTPRAPYWLHLAYGNMQGTRVATSTSDEGLSAFATGDGHQVDVLIGRHEACSPSEPLCPQPGPSPAPAAITVAIRTGGPNRAVTLALERIPFTRDPVPSQPAVQTVSGVVRNGVVQVAIPSFADGDAYSIVVS